MLGSNRIERWRDFCASLPVSRRGLPIAVFPDRDAIVDDAVRTVARLAEAKAADAATPAAVDEYLDDGGRLESGRARYESAARRRRADRRLAAAQDRAARSRGRMDLLRELALERRELVRGIVIDELSGHVVVGAVVDDGFPARDRRAT